VPTTTQTSRSIDALRRGADLATEPESLPLARVENADIKRARAYPMQPPTIPHAIDGYQVDQHANRCMLCHGQVNSTQFRRRRSSHPLHDRDSQVVEISPRRHFCVQCPSCRPMQAADREHHHRRRRHPRRHAPGQG
jgi:cytochrome c-type protein NapB